ncbi:MAG: hypothetical protein VR65_11625 [Desulfobulbaceae bacterium BRH_c16a]|nr:MAG: hypothetical protein VR65_11625 [Desulfobulbaceae bacterium BRH_c16a]
MISVNNITVIAAVNDRVVSESNLFRSPLLSADGVQFITARGFSAASQAYNYGTARATGEILIFVHQDVYIPAGWHRQLLAAVAVLDRKDPAWAVLGVVGVDSLGAVKGCSWSTGLGREVGNSVQQPEPAVSLDELILVVKKSSGLHFDDKLQGWHLYGTDIVQEALHMGMGAYIIHAPVIHNSLPIVRLNEDFAQCYSYLCGKWANSLPIQTCCTRMTRFGWPLLKRRIGQIFRATNRNIHERLADPTTKARELGYE